MIVFKNIFVLILAYPTAVIDNKIINVKLTKVLLNRLKFISYISYNVNTISINLYTKLTSLLPSN